MVAAIGLAVGAVGGSAAVVGHFRHSQDAAWCRRVTPTVFTLRGVPTPVPAAQLATARDACVAERRAQRGLLGAVWRTGGEQMAACGVEFGRYQQLAATDPVGAEAVTAPYGITGPLDESRSDQQRFINTCLKAKRTH